MFVQKFLSQIHTCGWLFPIMLALTVSGCMLEFPFATDDISGGRGGAGDQIVLHLPIPSGETSRCTQGAGGDYSHSTSSTFHDIDLDTDNYSDEEVYAPISGTAHVHTDSATSGFGYHINIDIGEGQYVLLGHLKEVFVNDEDEVAAGQLIAYEGCTGNCSGDHIHLGLHEGDASEDAINGTSISVSYLVTDMNEEDPSEQIISGDDFVCGIKDEGDPVDGHIYKSSLPVTLWHPDGTLIKVPDDPKVYVLSDGEKNWFEDEQVFWSHNYDFEDMSLVSSEERDCYGSGMDHDDQTLIDAVRDGWDVIWLLVGEDSDENAYKIEVQHTDWEQVLSSWGLSYTEDTLPNDGNLSESMLAHSTREGYAGFRDGTLLTETGSSDVYVITRGVAVPIKDWDTYLMLGFHDREIIAVDDGVVSQIHEEVGNCSADVWCLDQEAITTCGGGFDLGSGGDVGGEETGDDDDVVEEEQEEEEEEVEEEEENEEEEPAQDCAGEDACIVDLDGDGLGETLLITDDQWLSTSLDSMPAFVYGNGGCFGGNLDMEDLVYSSDGYYQIDFSDFFHDCTVELSLVSSIGTDGGSPETDMSNWYWWQNADFCAAGSSLCELMDNNTNWEEWLLSVEWDPTNGLIATGNGHTSNDQL